MLYLMFSPLQWFNSPLKTNRLVCWSCFLLPGKYPVPGKGAPGLYPEPGGTYTPATHIEKKKPFNHQCAVCQNETLSGSHHFSFPPISILIVFISKQESHLLGKHSQTHSSAWNWVEPLKFVLDDHIWGSSQLWWSARRKVKAAGVGAKAELHGFSEESCWIVLILMRHCSFGSRNLQQHPVNPHLRYPPQLCLWLELLRWSLGTLDVMASCVQRTPTVEEPLFFFFAKRIKKNYWLFWDK